MFIYKTIHFLVGKLVKYNIVNNLGVNEYEGNPTKSVNTKI